MRIFLLLYFSSSQYLQELSNDVVLVARDDYFITEGDTILPERYAGQTGFSYHSLEPDPDISAT